MVWLWRSEFILRPHPLQCLFFFISKGRPSINRYFGWGRTAQLIELMTCGIFGDETLMLWHIREVSTHHQVSRFRWLTLRTNICFLNMIICIKIWINLDMIVVPSWFLRFDIVVEITSTVERAYGVGDDWRAILVLCLFLMMTSISVVLLLVVLPQISHFWRGLILRTTGVTMMRWLLLISKWVAMVHQIVMNSTILRAVVNIIDSVS